MYTILVGHTGLGKGRAINPAVNILRDANSANVMSDKLTIQYILEKISDRGMGQQATLQWSPSPSGSPSALGTSTVTLNSDASCFISAPEIEDFLTMSDTLAPLKELWEGKDGPFEYGTRGRGLVKITKPCPTLLGGCTPSQVALLFPNRTVGGGLVRRINFVYAADRERIIPWPIERNGYDIFRQSLVDDLRHIATLRGQFNFDPVAKKIFTSYYNETGCDEFADEATSSYETSRFFHAVKLSMCLALSQDDRMIINFVDAVKAIEMINHVCEDLKRVFRSVGDSETAGAIDKIIRFLEIRTKQSFVTRSDIMAATWKDVGTTQNLDVLLATLEAAKIVRTEQHSGITIYKLVKPSASR